MRGPVEQFQRRNVDFGLYSPAPGELLLGLGCPRIDSGMPISVHHGILVLDSENTGFVEAVG